MSPIVNRLLEQLDALRQQWWFFSLLTTITFGFGVLLGLFFLLMLLDAYCRLSQGGLIFCASVWLCVVIYILFLITRRLLRDSRTIDGTARMIENEFPQLESRLINLVQFARNLGSTIVSDSVDTEKSERGKNGTVVGTESTAMAPASSMTQAFELAAANRAAAEIDPDEILTVSKRFGRWTRFRRQMQTPRDWCESLVFLAIVVIFAVVANQKFPAWGAAANRLLQPWSFQPAIGAVGTIRVTPGDTEVLIDSDLEIIGEIERAIVPDKRASNGRGYLWVEELANSETDGTVNQTNRAEHEIGDAAGTSKERKIPMVCDADGKTFRATLSAITKPIRYRLEIGDSQSKQYEVRIQPLVTSGKIQVTYRYPAYLGRKNETKEPQRIADLDAPQYTMAGLSIAISRPVTECFIAFGDGTAAKNVADKKDVGTKNTDTKNSNAEDTNAKDTSENATNRPNATPDASWLRCKLDETGTTATVDVPMRENGVFRILFFIDGEQVNRQPRVNRLTVRTDHPPVVELLSPANDLTAKPGETISIKFRVNDDYTIGSVKLLTQFQHANDSETPTDPAEDQNVQNAPDAVDATKVDTMNTDTTSSGGTNDGTGADERNAADTVQETAKDAKTANVAEVTAETWDDFTASESSRNIETTLKIPADLVTGDRVIFRVEASDRRTILATVTSDGKPLGPQTGSSGRRTVQIVSREEQAEKVAEEVQNLRAQIWKILEKQLLTRIFTEKDGLTADVRTVQVAVQRDSAALAAQTSDDEKGERKSIRRRLGELAAGEMQTAVQLCDTGTRSLPTTATESIESTNPAEPIKSESATDTAAESNPMAESTDAGKSDGVTAKDNVTESNSVAKSDTEADPTVHSLIESQDRIIAELRSILGTARAVAARSEEALQKKRAGDDLPDDVKKTYEEARKKLEEFMKVQRKVMEASEELAKKPVEDFTEEDEQKLKELAALEDDWSRFMKDLQSDFSKLPEQDFANASLAKELAEIQTEIKMAEGALTAKTVDIAVPLEQLGYEMAENMTTNIERWLPDSPDRERWSQEESPSDADKEAPMAELPGELEDLVGELMEDEEDLFSEMEDVTSSAIDSLDKGAGWDAADGPISNNSARGVTGNRLPNESEIAGRSGEGRQGRSSGEMVGDEAVGKGGRKTPTRLTQDAYQKGQIKDYSQDPTGGATGGGKESGQGGTGLEGPAAPQRQRDLERLAGRQAELRNRAEAISAKFSVQNRPTEDISVMIEAMATVETELKAGNYQNALRQRKILVDRNASLMTDLSGGFEISEDVSKNLPKEIRDQISSGTKEPAPDGWEELSRQYLESLNQ